MTHSSSIRRISERFDDFSFSGSYDDSVSPIGVTYRDVIRSFLAYESELHNEHRALSPDMEFVSYFASYRLILRVSTHGRPLIVFAVLGIGVDDLAGWLGSTMGSRLRATFTYIPRGTIHASDGILEIEDNIPPRTSTGIGRIRLSTWWFPEVIETSRVLALGRRLAAYCQQRSGTQVTHFAEFALQDRGVKSAFSASADGTLPFVYEDLLTAFRVLMTDVYRSGHDYWTGLSTYVTVVDGSVSMIAGLLMIAPQDEGVFVGGSNSILTVNGTVHQSFSSQNTSSGDRESLSMSN